MGSNALVGREAEVDPEIDNMLTTEVISKYSEAGNIAEEVIKLIAAKCVDGADISLLC